MSYYHVPTFPGKKIWDPLNPEDIADKIIRLINDQALRDEMVANGTKKLATFPSAAQRAAAYIDICEKIAARQI